MKYIFISRKAANKAKGKLPEKDGENITSLKWSKIKNTKNVEKFLVENITEIIYQSEDENLHK